MRVGELWYAAIGNEIYVWNGMDRLSGQDTIFSKTATGTTPSNPSVNITRLSEM